MSTTTPGQSPVGQSGGSTKNQFSQLAPAWISSITGVVGLVLSASHAMNSSILKGVGLTLVGFALITGVATVVVVVWDNRRGRVPAALALVGIIIGSGVYGNVLSSSVSSTPPPALQVANLHVLGDVAKGRGTSIQGTISGALPAGTVLWPELQDSRDMSKFYLVSEGCALLNQGNVFECDRIILGDVGVWQVHLALVDPAQARTLGRAAVSDADCQGKIPGCIPGSEVSEDLVGQPIPGGTIAVPVG